MMNKNALYFRLIDFVSISYFGLIILYSLGLPGWANILETGFTLLAGLTALTINLARHDEFALLCRDNAFAVLGRMALISGPFIMIALGPFGAVFLDGITGSESGSTYEHLTLMGPLRIGVAIWLVAFGIYLISFQWVRFRGQFQ
ncbi:hypothetical protein ACR9YC_05110 [Parasphingorhabdus sp. DH2-15]|uniref:hypothetical protein n=1 Tax=Parasphingorhabdus sp. DH2-15 TaxID=3444112 RepID=UPI003F6882C6